MNAIDYHGKNSEFEVGMTVTHITDEGVTCKGKIVETKDDLLLIKFTDGEEGWEKAETCFV